jgi:RNA methyltransferase, TrmH family
MSVLSSRDNPKVKRWSKLAQDPRYRRSEGRALIEGPHVLAAALQHGCKPIAILATEEGAADPEIGRLIGQSGMRPVLLSKGVFRAIVDAETPQGVAAEIAIPTANGDLGSRAAFLEGVQDPGNVGAIIRSAAAFGVKTLVLDQDCADPWSPRALRAGMGGHFTVQIRQEKALAPHLEAFEGKVLCTVVVDGTPIAQADLGEPLAWVFGAEGRGVSEETLRRAKGRIRIPLAPGMESLNVAATAAICFYELTRKAS